MTDRSYIGIDSTDNKEWVAVVWSDGHAIVSPPFKNTPTELAALVSFITERCARPKICLKPSNPSAIKLIKSIGGIPDVEVVLMSNAGLRMHQSWLQGKTATAFINNNPCQAYLLAFCAQRMV
jgi:hypothetical protein